MRTKGVYEKLSTDCVNIINMNDMKFSCVMVTRFVVKRVQWNVNVENSRWVNDEVVGKQCYCWVSHSLILCGRDCGRFKILSGGTELYFKKFYVSVREFNF